MAGQIKNYQVIKEIRRKDAEGNFEEPVKISVDQKFVGSLLNSHNNNLEEQAILGVDCLDIEWQDDNVGYITRRFVDAQHTEEISDDGYYILFIEDYSNTSQFADFYFEGTTLHIPIYDTSGARYSTEGNALIAEKPDIFFFESLEADPTALIIRPARVLKRELLCFRPDKTRTEETYIDDLDIKISEKLTIQKVKVDGQSTRTYNQSSITNYLAD